MEFTHFTFEDSSKKVPHFAVNAFYKGNWVGHYERHGDWIYDVYITNEMRGKGMCQKMLRHALKQKKHLRLQVLENNPAAQRCYSKLGFKEISRKNGVIDMVYIHR